ncbi:hypothetical protein Cal7507_0451 [Calothrix sp. PCC 7507]|nr:hypothetical protein Cal7507_0451 [Calothrix sp. PCC 7507]
MLQGMMFNPIIFINQHKANKTGHFSPLGLIFFAQILICQDSI